MTDRQEGSSPLTRGKRHRSPRTCGAHGLIPAHAGKTCASRKREWTCWAHPRSRGENAPDELSADFLRGSSPLTRGKLRGKDRQGSTPGLIPAHAGKTVSSARRPGVVEAHPRSRGENRSASSSPSFRVGSSPLTRGKPPPTATPRRIRGLIPAHAGKTAARAAAIKSARAHPRSRGENPVGGAFPARSEGSSPLTRGKPARYGQWGLPCGLIPAHAGKTLRPRSRPVALRAHPRSRGENISPTS